MKIGDSVKVINSTHPDIQNGTVGVVESVNKEGVGVEVEASFYSGSTHKMEKRVVFCETKNLQSI